MAEEQAGDDDAFLYGEDAEQEVSRQDEVAEAANGDGTSGERPGPAAEVAGQEANATDGTGEAEVEAEGGGGEEDDEDEDSDDEDLVTIDINQQQIQDVTRRHQTFGLNKAVRQIPGAGEKKGKFAVEEFEQVGTVNGKPAHEFDIETLEDKPWRKPGADITDYFNYGFSEDTWNAYCQRQRRIRQSETGAVGMHTGGAMKQILQQPGSAAPIVGASQAIPTVGPPKRLPTVLNRTSVPPPTSTATPNTSIPPPTSGPPPAAAAEPSPVPISVMTHEKRQYPKNKGPMGIDFSMPPPGLPPPGLPPPGMPPPGIPPPGFDGGPPPMSDFPGDDPFGQGGDDYYGAGMEPTMESQWSEPPPSSNPDAPPGDERYDERHMREGDVWRGPASSRHHHHHSRSPPPPHAYPPRDPRDSRERERDRERERERDRERERGSRERKRRRSRSRSPPLSAGPPSGRYSGRDRDRERERERGERSERERNRSRSRSPAPSRRSRESKRERRDGSRERSSRRDIKTEIKSERMDD